MLGRWNFPAQLCEGKTQQTQTKQKEYARWLTRRGNYNILANFSSIWGFAVFTHVRKSWRKNVSVECLCDLIRLYPEYELFLGVLYAKHLLHYGRLQRLEVRSLQLGNTYSIIHN